MFSGILGGLFFAFILAFFGADNAFLKAVEPFIDVELTTAHWYIMFAIIGGIAGLFGRDN